MKSNYKGEVVPEFNNSLEEFLYNYYPNIGVGEPIPDKVWEEYELYCITGRKITWQDEEEERQ